MIKIKDNSIQFVIENMKNINTLSITCMINIEAMLSISSDFKFKSENKVMLLKEYKINILSSKCWLTFETNTIVFHIEIEANITFNDNIQHCHTSKCIYLKNIECEQFEFDADSNESLPVPCSMKNIGDYCIIANNERYPDTMVVSYQNRVIARIRYENKSAEVTSVLPSTSVSQLPKECSSFFDTLLCSGTRNLNDNDMERWMTVLNNKYQLKGDAYIQVRCQCCGADLIKTKYPSTMHMNKHIACCGKGETDIADSCNRSNPYLKTNLGEIKFIRHLPSGTFDHMMHNFICSEERSALFTSDILPTKDTMLNGLISCSLHPSLFETPKTNMKSDEEFDATPTPSVYMKCKYNNSCLDLLLNAGGSGNNNTNALKSSKTHASVNCMSNCCTSNNAMIPFKLLKEYMLYSASVIHIETCRIHCMRCHQYVGDGVFDTDAVTEHDDTGTDEPDLDIHLNDLCDVRLLGSGIEMNLIRHASKPNDSINYCMTAEHVIARTLWQLNQSSGVNNFFLFPEEIFPCLLLANKRSNNSSGKSDECSKSSVCSNDHFMGVYIKLIGKEYNIHISGREDPDGGEYRPKSGLKIEYCLYDVFLTKTGETETKSRKKYEYSVNRMEWNAFHECFDVRGHNNHDTGARKSNISGLDSTVSSIPMKKEKLYVPVTLYDMKMVETVLFNRYPLFNESGTCNRHDDTSRFNAFSNNHVNVLLFE